MKITIARIGPPDHAGSILAPGSVPAASVPLCEDFDPMLRPIGRVEVHADGSGEVELLPGVALDVENLRADETIGLAFRVLDQHMDGNVRVIDRLEVFAVGVSRSLIIRNGERCD
jgi:hypothetical protein